MTAQINYEENRRSPKFPIPPKILLILIGLSVVLAYLLVSGSLVAPTAVATTALTPLSDQVLSTYAVAGNSSSIIVVSEEPLRPLMISAQAVANSTTSISQFQSGYPNPNDFCQQLEQLLGEDCDWEAEFLEYPGGEKVIKISFHSASGKVLAELNAQYLNLTEYFTNIPAQTSGWVTYIKVSAEGLGLGSLGWRLLDGAIARVSDLAGLQRLVVFVDRVGWGQALMAKLPPDLVTRVSEKVWFYIP